MRSDSEMVNLRSVIETLCYMVGEDSDGVEEVMQLPTIDLVRCGECKHCSLDVCVERTVSGKERCINICNRHSTEWVVDEDWFCADGERKER